MKKVLFVITKSNWGGAQRYVFDMATHMKDIAEVAVVLGGNGTLAERLRENGIRIIHVPSLERDIDVFKDFKSFLDLVSIFKKERPDVINVNSSKIGGLGALAGRLTGVSKIIFTVHGWPFKEDIHWFKQWVIRAISYISVFFSHQSIVIAETELNEIKNIFHLNKKISLIYNGIGKVDFLKKEEARKELGLPSKKRGVVTIGTIAELHFNKAYEYTLRALAKLKRISPELEWEFVSIGEGELKEKLKDMTVELGLENDVHFLGYIRDAVRLLPAFDIFILPSLKEGFPYTLLEAGKSELPIITTSVGGIPNIIEDGISGVLIRPKNYDELATALRELAENAELRKKYGKNLKKRVDKEFSFEKMFGETVRVFGLE